MFTGNIYFIAAIAVIGGGLFGFDISSMSAILGTEQYLCYFDQYPKTPGKKCGGPKPNVQGGITASMAGGSWLGAIISGFLSDICGRKGAIMWGAVIWIIGSAIVCASQNITMLIVGRVLNGLSVGICSAQVPVYISELAPPSKRGRLVGCQQWAITWGIMIMFYISYGCSFVKGPAAFRIPWGLQAIPAVLLLLGMIPLPESPRWLARKGKWDRCHAVLVAVHGKGDPNSPFVEREFKEIRDMCEFEMHNADVTYWELLKPSMINRTHVGVFTQIWSQLTGMNVMMYYITYVFAMAGLKGSTLLVSSSIQYVINVGMTIPALLFVDRWGRRPTLLVGAFFMMIWLFINAGVLATYGSPAPPGGLDGIEAVSWQIYGPPSKVIIACSYLFVASFAPTWGPVSWIYPPELFPLRVRGKAVALCTSANWAFNFALGYFVPPAFVNIQWRTYILFGVFCAAMFVHVFFMFPETAGKTLEEVEDLFTSNIPAWKTRVAFDRAAQLERTGARDEEDKLQRDSVTEQPTADKAN
ncbi:high affinity glucose transporter [Ophidiomyces ophidiicola]|uniref:high affinity glucose transporter n=1 Tax=Ophidiomyces ophidiicola TaxID=1387563 RepID=UPI0020C527ED|nr:high affinity glucose transporter [Ophidiomyces ophidiicola]KAI1912602.1 high affinity glucose transporter [Ophidiomyces ophidiicola]KAI1927524.1 high affinity glucose transporter [Ophidiomyces ophidiicola]KAI1940799.1 high affinity glucose transporter [Ophidiomyces ophidiicola]KAI1951380.1 high affinity glucose transporter [Ophidiomyces ophidiicola]KAI1959254.1 high affinity glucose transporter [Ophidiomyces ophidiicola]